MADAAVFDALVARHRGEVLRVCRSILRDEHLGADAAQETFLRLWRRMRETGPPESAPAWLRRAAVSSAIDLDRRRSVRRTEPVVEDTLADTRQAGPLESDLRERFELALAELPGGQRTVFLLRHEAGMPLDEVAETLGIAKTTVKTQFARACLRLQAALATHRPGKEDER